MARQTPSNPYQIGRGGHPGAMTLIKIWYYGSHKSNRSALVHARQFFKSCRLPAAPM